MNKLPVWAIWLLCLAGCAAFWTLVGFVIHGMFK